MEPSLKCQYLIYNNPLNGTPVTGEQTSLTVMCIQKIEAHEWKKAESKMLINSRNRICEGTLRVNDLNVFEAVVWHIFEGGFKVRFPSPSLLMSQLLNALC